MADQFSTFLNKDVKENVTHTPNTHLLDKFYFNELNTKAYNDLSMIVQLLLELSYCHSTIEGEVNENKAFLDEKIDQESIISHCCIKDYMHANNHKPHEVKTTDTMILSVKSARKNYEQYFQDLKLSKENMSLTKERERERERDRDRDRERKRERESDSGKRTERGIAKEIKQKGHLNV